MHNLKNNEEIVTFLKELIKNYHIETSDKKNIIAKDIVQYANSIDAFTFCIEDQVLESINQRTYNLYNDLRKKDALIQRLHIEDERELFDNNNYNEDFAKDEFDYIKFLVSKINMHWIPKRYTSLTQSTKVINDYLVNSQFYDDFTKTLMFFNEKFRVSTGFCLSDNHILLLNSNNDEIILHEFLHGYCNKCNLNKNNNKYNETRSIIGELAIISKYNLPITIDRIKYMLKYYTSKFNNLDFDNLNFVDGKVIQYILGTLISVTYVWNNGNEIDCVENFINVMLKNNNKSIFEILKLLDIYEKDIITSFNNVDKILSYKKSFN